MHSGKLASFLSVRALIFVLSRAVTVLMDELSLFRLSRAVAFYLSPSAATGGYLFLPLEKDTKKNV